MEKNITYKQISEKINKSEHTVKQWKQRFPKMLEYCKIGIFCEKNGLDLNKIAKLIEIQEMIKDK
ncbi:MAG: helix-turn-helix domain-containing protein [Campylobacterota bacterium]|nr:helix-turn-helix domain-containing protein [Campylobacterota bacterium]